MALKTMYPAKVNSPSGTLMFELTSSGTTLQMGGGHADKFPDPPNLATIGRYEDAETVLYTGKSGNNLTGLVRGFEGEAKTWPVGTEVARLLTAYDWDSIRQNHETHLAEETQHNFTENNDEISVDFRNKFFLIDSNNDVFYKPNGDGNAGSSLGEQGYINLWKVV